MRRTPTTVRRKLDPRETTRRRARYSANTVKGLFIRFGSIPGQYESTPEIRRDSPEIVHSRHPIAHDPS